jgi:hypothetical protein
LRRPFENIPNRPTAHFNLYEHVFTREVFAIRKQPDEAGQWHVTGCLTVPWPACRQIDLTVLPYDADTELVEWAREEIRNMDLTG